MTSRDIIKQFYSRLACVIAGVLTDVLLKSEDGQSVCDVGRPEGGSRQLYTIILPTSTEQETMVNRFAPVDKIHQALQAYHVVADERGEIVPSVHYCSCNAAGDHFQCLIYDSDEPNAKLIGVEYMIPESKFLELPAEEKKYWHSHVHEVMSGSLVLIGLRAGTVAETAAGALKAAEDAVKAVVGDGATGGAVPDAAELAALARVRKLYGKAM